MSPLTSDEIRLLNEVGYLAAARGDLQASQKIFGALERFRPHVAFPYIGMAMAQLNRRLRDEAVRTLDRGLACVEREEERSDLQAYRAMALHLAGRASECRRAIDAAGGHPLAQALAATPRH